VRALDAVDRHLARRTAPPGGGAEPADVAFTSQCVCPFPRLKCPRCAHPCGACEAASLAAAPPGDGPMLEVCADFPACKPGCACPARRRTSLPAYPPEHATVEEFHAAPPAVPPNHPEIPDSSRVVAVPGEPPRSEGAPTLRQLDNAVKFIMGLPGWDQTRRCTCASYPHTEDCGRDPTGAEPGTGKPGGER
jgi:hypothetical protein